jgi:carbonic anhydrase
MDLPLKLLRELESAIIVRQPGYRFVGREIEASRHMAAVVHYVEDLGVRDIVVCGHSLCSAVSKEQAVAHPHREPAGVGSLLERTRQRERSNSLGRKRVVQQVDFWSEFWTVKRPHLAEQLAVHGLYYIAESNLFTQYNADAAAFHPVLQGAEVCWPRPQNQ